MEVCISAADLVKPGPSVTHPRGPWKWVQTAWRSITVRKSALDLEEMTCVQKRAVSYIGIRALELSAS